MRWALAGAFVVLAFGCKREAPAAAATPPAGPTPTTAPAEQVAAGATAQPEAPDRIEHATCGTTAIDQASPPPGLAQVMRGIGAFSCVRGDAGVVWSIHFAGAADLPAEQSRRRMTLLAALLRADAAYDPAALSWQLQAMDNDARRTDGSVATAALLFRAPERMEGRFGRFEGIARDVREEEGETTLALSLDALGSERIEVAYPGIASDGVVDGARVVAYGVSVGHHVSRTLLGDRVVPEVVAAYVATRQEIASQEAVPPRAPTRPAAEQPQPAPRAHGRRHRSHREPSEGTAPAVGERPAPAGGGSFGGSRWNSGR